MSKKVLFVYIIYGLCGMQVVVTVFTDSNTLISFICKSRIFDTCGDTNCIFEDCSSIHCVMRVLFPWGLFLKYSKCKYFKVFLILVSIGWGREQRMSFIETGNQANSGLWWHYIIYVFKLDIVMFIE